MGYRTSTFVMQVPAVALSLYLVLVSTGPPPAVEKDVVDRMALQLGGGLDFRISPALTPCGKVRYNMVKTWVEDLPRTEPIRNTDPFAQDMLHLFGLEFGLGIKLAF